MNNSDLPIRLGILIATHTATWVEESQPVQWRPDPWRRHWRLNGLPFSHVLDELEAEYSSHGTIRRKFILDAYQDRPATELFVATMAWVATTVPIGTTKTAPCGPTWRHRDGSMWPRFKRHREERARSVAGPSQADIPSPTVGVVPLQSVMVGPAQAVLTSMGNRPEQQRPGQGRGDTHPAAGQREDRGHRQCRPPGRRSRRLQGLLRPKQAREPGRRLRHKLLYFAGYRSLHRPRPLIYDRLVAAAAARFPSAPLLPVIAEGVTTPSYQRYCAWAEDLAGEYRTGPAFIEWSLFALGSGIREELRK